MSRILRRPMFRGGRVSSYGTGIASGLADGGRVGFYNGGWEGYAGYGGKGDMVLGSDLMNFVNQNPKYGSLQFANTLDPKTRYAPTTYGGSRSGPQITDSPEFLKLYQNFMDPETMLINPDEVDVETGQTTEVAEADNLLFEGKTESDYVSPTMTMKEKEWSGEIDSSPSDVPPGVIINEGEVVIEEDTGIEEMADKYFALMGGDKAWKKDASDMAMLASAKLLKPGATVKSGLGEFMEAESAKGPGRAETIRKDATKFAITQDIQMEMLQKKLDSAESVAEKNIIAQQIRDLTKSYAPGITQKDITYGSSLEKGSAEHTMYLRKNKLSPSLVDEVATRKNVKDTTGIGTYMSLSEVNALGPVYYIDWQGIFNPETSTSDGTYLDIEKKKIIQFKGGELISEENIAIE